MPGDVFKANGYTFKGDNSFKIVFCPFGKGVYTKRKDMKWTFILE